MSTLRSCQRHFCCPVTFVSLYIFYINVITIADTHVGIYAFVNVRGKKVVRLRKYPKHKIQD